MTAFDSYYSRVVFFGLVLLVWFCALNKAAHDIWAACVFFAGVTVLGLIFCAGRFRDQKAVKLPLLLPWVLFLMALAASSWHSYDMDSTWLEFWGWFYAGCFAYLMLNAVNDTAGRERFFLATGGVVGVLALRCLWEQFTLQPVEYGFFDITLPWRSGQPAWTVRYGHWEIHATLINSIVLAGFVLHWPLTYWEKALSDRRFKLLVAACLITLAIARSLWAWAALAFGYGLYYREAFLKLAKRHQNKAIGAIGVIAIAGVFLLYLKTHHRALGPASAPRYQAGSRLHYWRSALSMGQQSACTGVGLGAFATAFPYFKQGQVENTRFAHNFPLQIWAETGAAGLGALLLLLLNYLRLRLQKDPKTGRRSPLTVSDITLITVFAYSLISIHMDFLLNKALFLAFLLSALLAAVPLKGYRLKPLWAATTGVSLLFLSSFWLSLFEANRLHVSGLQYQQMGDFPKAIEAYQAAIDLEPFHAESYWQLSNIAKKTYEKTHSSEDRTAAQALLTQALRYKKDVRFLH